MPIYNLQLSFDNVNISAQVGDIVYFTAPSDSVGGFNNSSVANTSRLGNIISINHINNTVTVAYDSSHDTPDAGDYISFAKDKRVNTSSLLGYYASVNFTNNSRGKIELFSVGSDISESSK